MPVEEWFSRAIGGHQGRSTRGRLRASDSKVPCHQVKGHLLMSWRERSVCTHECAFFVLHVRVESPAHIEADVVVGPQAPLPINLDVGLIVVRRSFTLLAGSHDLLAGHRIVATHPGVYEVRGRDAPR